MTARPGLTVGCVWAPAGVGAGSQEPLLLGSFQKYSNNFGWVNLADLQRHLHAFSHWTYEVTDRLLMVTDIQVGLHTTRTNRPGIIITPHRQGSIA